MKNLRSSIIHVVECSRINRQKASWEGTSLQRLDLRKEEKDKQRIDVGTNTTIESEYSFEVFMLKQWNWIK